MLICHTLSYVRKTTKQKPLKTERVSARLSPEVARQLRELAAVSESDISEVIMASIIERYERMMGERTNPLAIFKAAGFIGCGEGREDLASNYKNILSASLKKKYDPS